MKFNFIDLELIRRINKIAIPTIIGFFGIIIFEATDLYWLAKIDTKAVAALGGASFLEWMLYTLMLSTNVGATTLIAQFIGSKQVEKTYEVIRNSFQLSIIISLILMTLFFISTNFFFSFMGLDAETTQYAKDYFYYILFGLPIIYTFALQSHIFNAHGDTKISNAIMLFTIIINIALDPVLIFGMWGVPALGVKGASIATVTGQLIGVILRAIVLYKKGYIKSFSFLVKIKKHQFSKKILSIGVPAASSNFIWTLIFPLLTVLITQFGMEPLAGLNVGHRIEGIPYFFSEGLSIAITALVAQAFGRKDFKEIRLLVFHGIGIITVALFFFSALFLFIPEYMASILVDDPVIIAHAVEYLKIIGIFEIFLGWEIIMEGAFNGISLSKVQMYIRVPLTLVRFPLAYLLAFSFGMGISGIWWAISITTFIKGVFLFWIFQKKYVHSLNKYV